jgi:O-antigen ligase
MLSNNLKYKSLIQYIFAAFLFSIALFPKLIVLLLILLVLAWISEGGFKEKFSFIAENKIFLVLPSIFLLYLLGMIYTENTSYGWTKMETRLGLFLIPLSMPTLWSLEFKNKSKFYTKAYILGISLAMIFCHTRSITLFSYELYCREHRIILEDYPYTNYFFSSHLSYFMHYGYFSMYVNIAIILLLEHIREFKNILSKNKLILYFSLIFFLSIFVLMLYSKAGIISMFLIFIAFGIHMAYIYKKAKYLAYMLLSMSLLFYLLYNYIPHTNERIKGMLDGFEESNLDPNSTESTQSRIFAWKAATELIKAQPIFGYGSGDSNDVLLKKYAERGYNGVLENELNAHNQFFQTHLSIGILGVILMLVFFIYLLIVALKLKSFPVFIFSIIGFLVLLFESYFETQAGIFFIAVISVFLTSMAIHQKKLSH